MGAVCEKCSGRNEAEITQAQIEAPLSSTEVALVKKTWGQVAALGVETVGVILFKHIFTIAPGALQLFSFKSEANVYESAALKAHGKRVVGTVGAAVEGLDDLDALVPVLQALALRHVGYGVLPEHFDIVGKALMNSLEDGLQSDFTTEVRLAWSKVWHIVASTMITAGWPATMSTGPESVGVVGKQSSRLVEQPVFAKAQIEAPLSSIEVDVVKKTWGQVAELGVETVGVILFKHIFTIAPGALQLFSFKSEANVYESAALKAHGKRVVGTVGAAVEGLDDLDALVPVLQALALRHVGYGVLPEHFDIVGRALMNSLQDGLQSDFTTEVRLAWSKVWHVVASTMIAAGWPAQQE